jgi:hypothetical protein
MNILVHYSLIYRCVALQQILRHTLFTIIVLVYSYIPHCMQAYLSTHGPHLSIPDIKQGTNNVNLLRHCFNLVLECAENRKHNIHYKYTSIVVHIFGTSITTSPDSGV